MVVVPSFHAIVMEHGLAYFETDERARKRQWQPNPAMHAAGGDATEHGTDIAAKGQARAVAHDQARQQPHRPLFGS